MSIPIPERRDLGQLRRQAKELRDAARRGDADAAERIARHHNGTLQGAVTLAIAQLVIAREQGFASWPKLKAASDADASAGRAVEDFLAASVEGGMRQAASILQASPGIAGRSLRAAAVLGDVRAAREVLTADPAAAAAIDDRGWPPLLYACYSRWHQADPGRAPAIAEVARLLLDAGASPNTNNGARTGYRSALTGSIDVNNPEVTKVLLEAGANPDDHQTIGWAAFSGYHRCLELLLSHGARVAGTWAIDGAVGGDDARVVSLLLAELPASTGEAAQKATELLPEAAANASLQVVNALLEAGADPSVSDEDGVSALRRAVRAGKDDTAARLTGVGTPDDATDVDHFIGACLNADRDRAERLLSAHPGLPDLFDDQDRAVIVQAAGSRPAETIALMCDLGFSPNARNSHGFGWGEQPLHSAAYTGNVEVVRLLLAVGAEIDARDARFDATPLCYATVGSREQADKPGDWIGTVRLLIDAGASRQGVWISGKPPSEEVMDVLRSYGITSDASPEQERGEQERDEQEHDGEADVPGLIGTGVMADIARHLKAACRDLDLELFASLLHPQVRWVTCGTRDEVLDWYRQLVAAGTTATVHSVEVDGDSVILAMTMAWGADGARPGPQERVYQVFTVAGAEIVQIRSYPDRRSALAHA
jgi:ankyrin repeat protein